MHIRRGTDLVEAIGFSPSTKITLGDVVARYGAPDVADAGQVGTPEHLMTGMTLHLEDIGVILGLPEQEGAASLLEEATGISGISDAREQWYKRAGITDLPRRKGYGEYRQTSFHR